MQEIVILHSDVPENASEDELDCLLQADVIGQALSALGRSSVRLPFVMDLKANMSNLASLKPDIVFNLVETLAGKGSMAYFAPSLLDALRLPYTGCRTEAMFVTSNKPLAKRILRQSGIATPPWMSADGKTAGTFAGGTYLLKPSWEDASVGLDDDAVVETQHPQALHDALLSRQTKLGLECFAEAYIDGREFNIALLAKEGGVRILNPAEILFMDYPADKLKLLDYRAKWIVDSFEYDNTRRTLDLGPQDTGLANRLQEIALQCWHLFGLRGYARVDFRVDSNGTPWVLEVNANPCLSPDAGFAAALDHAGIKYSQAIDDILRDALQP